MYETHKSWVILGIGVALGVLATKLVSHLRQAKQQHAKTNILDCVGNTPLLYL